MMNRQLLSLVAIFVISTMVIDAKKVVAVAADGTVHGVHVEKLPKRAVNVVEHHVHDTSSSSGSAESDNAPLHGYRKVPKLVKMTTKLELCKLECKRQQDEEDAQQYVERLRFELSAAELALQQHVDLMRQQVHHYESQQHDTVIDHHATNEHHQQKHA